MSGTETSVAYLKGVGPSRAALLASELGIHSVADLANLFPNRYIDRSRFYKIAELTEATADVQVIGEIVSVKTVKQKRGSRLVATFRDSTGQMELIWFRSQKWIAQQLKPGVPYVAFGRVTQYMGTYSMAHPELDKQEDYQKELRGSMQAIYPSTEKLQTKGFSNRAMQKVMQQLFQEKGAQFKETLSEDLIARLKLMGKAEAMRAVHFPQSPEQLARAQFRLKFEELFFVQLQLIVKKMIRKQKIKGFLFDKVGDNFNDFFHQHLPFELTGAQKKVVREIRKDLGSGAQMNRLLQGDVGSGKTMVAVLIMLLALDNGFQSALVAPTEILAVQHHQSVSELLAPMGIEVALLTGSTRAAQRKILHQGLRDGSVSVLIGTHALFEQSVQFHNLGLAIIDEQHRFGVAQRARMWAKNDLPPHVLVMTATPIPRTLAMSVYGDLDISVIDELPPGRKDIKTVHRKDSNRLSVFKFLKEEIARGRQVYMVYPLIKESEKMDYKDLMDGYESVLREFPRPTYQVSIVHGKMKSADKDYEMQRFVKGETQIMVATTVIEVGVNVPNASVMIVESAERFGLSQLHQLRGRVGRGAEQSYCILMSGHKLSEEAKTRLQTMVETNDGFKIAEADLKLRGPGDLMGTQQSGVLQLKIADLVKDQNLMSLARSHAFEVAKAREKGEDQTHQNIWRTYQQLVKHKRLWSEIS